MKRRLINIVITIFLSFFCFLNTTFALSCAEIEKEINNYNAINDELSTLDCTIDDDQAIVNNCNRLNLEKNSSLNILYHAQEDAKSCSSTKGAVDTILSENEDNCGTVFNDTIDNFISYVMGIFYIIGPILLILFGVLDFSRVTVSNDKEALKKATKKFGKRLLATILLFLSPLITRLILNFNTSGYNLSGDAYVCNYNNAVYKKEYTIIYISNPTNSNSNISLDAEFFSWKQRDPKWSSILLGRGPATNLGDIGCTTTAIAIQIASSGVAQESFNPGVLATAIKSGGAYTAGGAMNWANASNAWQTVAPGFKYVQQVMITGDASSKASQLANYINQGYYPVVEVKCRDNAGKCDNQHWVAAVAVQGGNIVFSDPGGKSNDVVNNSSYTYSNPNKNKRVQLYKVE